MRLVSFKKMKIPLLVLGAAGLLSSCSSNDDSPSVTVNPAIGVLSPLASCWTGDLNSLNATCGTVGVPADYNNSGGPDVRQVGYAVLPALNAGEATGQPPLVFLVGGPGPSTTAQANEFGNGKPLGFMRNNREVILMDYRGVGSSEPALDCAFPKDATGAAACAKVVTDSVLDFSDMLSSVFAKDMDQLLKSLGHANAFVYGGSYGTRLALTAMRDVPGRLSGVILDGVFPVEVNGFSQGAVAPLAGLDAIVGRCSASTECTQTVGDTRSQIESLVSTWTAAEIGKQDQQLALNQLGKLAYHPAAPLLVKQLSEAEAASSIAVLKQFDELLVYIDGSPYTEQSGDANIPAESASQANSAPMALSVVCAEEASFIESQSIKSAMGYPFGFSDSILNTMSGFQGGAPIDVTTAGVVCDAFGAPAAGALESMAVTSSIPTLVLNGGRDSQTSFVWGNQAAANLSNSTSALIPLSDHITANYSECAQSLINRFIAAPSDALDTSCATGLIQPVITESENIVKEILCDSRNLLASAIPVCT